MQLKVMRPFNQLLSLLCAVLITIACGGSGGGGSGGGAIEGGPLEQPGTDPSAGTEEPAPGVKTEEEQEKEEDIGIVTAPVNPEGVVSIEATTEPALRHLEVTTTDDQEDGRYLTEYLVVASAREDSCLRLKVRPTEGLTSELGDAAVKADSDIEACSAPKQVSSVNPTPKTDETPETEGEAEAEAEATSLTLTSASLVTHALCSKRLFRMYQDESEWLALPNSLEKIVTKTGKLVATQDGVRVWLDEEHADLCSLGAVGDRDPIAFSALAKEYPAYGSFQDKLLKIQMDKLAAEAKKIYDKLSAKYGTISDLDSNGAFDIFISPEVNRSHFIDEWQTDIDNPITRIVLKPEDRARYNHITNPASNEGEIVYLYSPDPAGIYNYRMYPSSNSVTSNHAYGAIGAQLMSMMIDQKKLFDKNIGIEADFVRQALAYLASAYAGGNDFSWRAIAHFLSYRSHTVPLIDPVKKDDHPNSLYTYALVAQEGQRAMFGWYLHYKLCPSGGLEPCDAIVRLLDSDKLGAANLEEVLGAPIDKILGEFGLTIGAGMSPDPALVLAQFEKKLEGVKPLTMAYDLSVPTSQDSTIIEVMNDGTTSKDERDPAATGPFVNRDALLFQPILPDNDLDIAVRKNSIVYILVTGLITKKTDVSAYFGPGLSIDIFRIGERDTSKRKILVEKQSENAHLDLRPINLTDRRDTKGMNFAPIVNPTADTNFYTVTQTKELLFFGSTDNTSVLVEDEAQSVGDSDAIAFKIDPCDGSADETSCRASGYKRVLVQAMPRDFAKETTPVLLLSTLDKNLYRGHLGAPDIIKIDPDFKGSDENANYRICESGWGYSGADADATFCANGGIQAATFQTNICDDKTLTDACLPFTSGPESTTFTPQSWSYSDYTWQINKSYAVTFDNLLFSGPWGFPFFNDNTFYGVDEETSKKDRVFSKAQFQRQFFLFDFNESLLKHTYHFYPYLINPGTPNFSTGQLYKNVWGSQELLTDLAVAKKEVETAYAAAGTLSALSIARKLCSDEFGFEEDTCLAASTEQIENIIIGELNEMDEEFFLCVGGGSPKTCEFAEVFEVGHVDVTNTTSPLVTSKAWLPKERYVWRAENPSFSRQTYYQPIDPYIGSKGNGSVCDGGPTVSTDPDAYPHTSYCYVEEDNVVVEDIRVQINSEANKTILGCDQRKTYVLGENAQVCHDRYAYSLAIDPETHYSSKRLKKPLTTDRTRERTSSEMYTRSGEVIGLPIRMHYQMISVPSDKPSYVMSIVGGLKGSQGKYILRARVID